MEHNSNFKIDPIVSFGGINKRSGTSLAGNSIEGLQRSTGLVLGAVEEEAAKT